MPIMSPEQYRHIADENMPSLLQLLHSARNASDQNWKEHFSALCESPKKADVLAFLAFARGTTDERTLPKIDINLVQAAGTECTALSSHVCHIADERIAAAIIGLYKKAYRLALRSSCTMTDLPDS
ncbi:MAG: hypothetical protein PHN33_01545 [Candidatus Peribacteraceae bacterium]|nr:hypothetical protein [Candidatus Peribacteraceae bacterium]